MARAEDEDEPLPEAALTLPLATSESSLTARTHQVAIPPTRRCARRAPPTRTGCRAPGRGRATPAPGDKLPPERVTELRAVFEFGPTRTLQMDVEYDILRIVTSCTEQFGEKETMRVDQEFTGKS